MNQTVTVNISGIVFHIEVDAYDNLKKYLNKIKSYFNNSEECDEIMTDIEARIAELFSSKLTTAKQVINSKDVEEVITIMGKPEQYIDEEDIDDSKKEKTKKSTYKTAKRLFRDPDERVLGGVASGIAAYFGLESIWVRLFFILILFIGFGPLFYIVLWLVIPEAKTASEKLEMKGEAVNIDNIGKTIEEEATKVNDKLKSIDTGKYAKQAETTFEAFFSFLLQILKGFFKVFGKIFGVIFLLIGLILLISVTLWLTIGEKMILSISDDGVFAAVQSPEFFNLLFPSLDMYYFFLLAFILTIGIPFVLLVYTGLKLLFNIKTHFSVGLSMFVLWLFGILSCGFLVFNIAKDQKNYDYVLENKILNETTSEVHIKLLEKEMPGNQILETKDFNMSIDKDLMYADLVSLKIKKSKTTECKIQIKYESRGMSKKDARENANAISYHYNIEDNTILFSDFISTPKINKIRSQKVAITIFLPINKVIYIDNSLKNVIYDIDNVTNTHDPKMLDKKWVMLEDGLTCLDCDKIDGITSLQLDSINAIKPIIEEIIEE